ncbi:hypothetical protein VNO77_04561 [Canavalia gladiata]|uniref:Uncharacterized protein n=1 Tax=Canavalia gladiata TaxID=3824 RepID=A0AAN9R7W3_CANGL
MALDSIFKPAPLFGASGIRPSSFPSTLMEVTDLPHGHWRCVQRSPKHVDAWILYARGTWGRSMGGIDGYQLCCGVSEL